MNFTSLRCQATVLFTLEWKSTGAHHREMLFTENVNFWRDIFPGDLGRELFSAEVGGNVCLNFEAGRFIPHSVPGDAHALALRQFAGSSPAASSGTPRAGRFYPKGRLLDVANVFKANLQPFRCTGVNATHFQADFNHPLAGKATTVTARLESISPKPADRGGSLTDWRELISEGPGMQARWRNQATDFFSDNPFCRADETPDAVFYAKPRLVNHLDSTAVAHIRRLYGDLLQPQSRVLDLMSSWTSHIPTDLKLQQLSGLGMNEVELQQNSDLTDYRVHDLNQTPMLPYASGHYDAVICTASVEYLIQPQKVLDELARVLRPGGRLAITFSNRWFAPKAIHIWQYLHEFERMGLVQELLMANGFFENINTLSMRGYPRPDDDKYADRMFCSDPVYAVWGTRKS